MLLGILLVKAASASLTSLVTLNALAARAAFKALLRNQIVESTEQASLKFGQVLKAILPTGSRDGAFTGQIQPSNAHIQVP